MTTKIIRQYLFVTSMFSFAASLSFGTYVSFLLSRGLNLFEVNLVNVAYFLAMFVCEIPTGAFADTFGRKRSYVISCVLFSVGMLAYSQAHGMFGFIVAEILAGVGRTFGNGAYHAWLVDTLDHHGYRGSIKRVFEREHHWRQVVIMPSAVLGSYIGSLNLAYPWFIGGSIGLMVAGIAFFTMKEEYFVPMASGSIRQSFGNMFGMARGGIDFARTSASIRMVICLSALLAFASQSLNMQWQPFFGTTQGSIPWSGYLSACIIGSIMCGIKSSSRILRLCGTERIMLPVCLVFSGVAVICSVATRESLVLSVAFFLIHQIPRAAYGPVKDGYLNESISQRERATVISCQSMFTHLASLLGLLVGGAVALRYSISTAWVMSGIVLVCGSCVLMWLYRKKLV